MDLDVIFLLLGVHSTSRHAAENVAVRAVVGVAGPCHPGAFARPRSVPGQAAGATDNVLD